MKKQTYSLFLLITLLIATPFTVRSAAWWGDGYKAPAWVLKHGGTMIHYTVLNGNPNKYKAIMYRDNKYVEVEFGQDAKFDDAKNGLYTIIFYKCDDSCREHKFHKKEKVRDKDKRITSINIQARPSETVHLIFDTKAKTVRIARRSGYIRPKTAAELIMEKATAHAHQSQIVRTPLEFFPTQRTPLPNTQLLHQHTLSL